jgi:hypothetical protein
MITACFAHAFQRYTSPTYIHFLLIFQEVRLISKTRNQLTNKIEDGVFCISPKGVYFSNTTYELRPQSQHNLLMFHNL